MKLEDKNNIKEQSSKICANTSYSINPKQKYIEHEKLDYIKEGRTPNTKIYLLIFLSAI